MIIANPRSSELLDLALRRIDRRVEAKQLFLRWPNLKNAALRLCAFLSPFLENNYMPLLDVALERVFSALETEPSGGDQVRVFVHAILSISEELRFLQVSIQDCDGAWEIWDFEHPILDWMHSLQRECIMIREREEPFSVGPVKIAVLSRVFTIRDLMLANLQVSTQ